MIAATQISTTSPADAAKAAGVSDFKFLEEFGAIADFDPQKSAGTDNTVAIQAAIDWAYSEGRGPPRALMVSAGNYLCGNVTVYPYTTIIGTGRQSSNFWCADGTSGKWWSDRGNGAQKLMLSGLAFYGRNQPRLTHICEFGSEGIQFGTEGVLTGLWMREAPNGVGLKVDGNVGIIRDITLLRCATGIKINGNGNQVENIICMESRDTGADLAGTFIRGLHLEATSSNGVPLRITGDCHVHDVFVSTAKATSFSHFFEVDNLNYDEWALTGVHLLGQDYVISNGMMKIGGEFRGGTDPRRFTGANVFARIDVHSGAFSLGNQAWHAFSIELTRLQGVLQHRIGSIGNPELPSHHVSGIGAARHWFGKTPMALELGDVFATGARIAADSPSKIMLDTKGKTAPEDQAIQCAVHRSSTGTVLTARAGFTSRGEKNSRSQTLTIQFFDAASGSEYDLNRLSEGQAITVGLSGFLA
ncbi:hypothetical protein GRI44_10330 [Altererythrobacter confluentis]|uniref:Pectate lyase superfamily protein n=1 Tax=Allopontixanthobacter confluentis TaxID=1849021 RepID=A0A6L7GIL6_9SPHN|nr:hypothetical protein [Allopontixanthobacter confluentis]MXP15144.1 hypothetical protein [Allopontixanthobacter confluentis]